MSDMLLNEESVADGQLDGIELGESGWEGTGGVRVGSAGGGETGRERVRRGEKWCGVNEKGAVLKVARKRVRSKIVEELQTGRMEGEEQTRVGFGQDQLPGDVEGPSGWPPPPPPPLAARGLLDNRSPPFPEIFSPPSTLTSASPSKRNTR